MDFGPTLLTVPLPSAYCGEATMSDHQHIRLPTDVHHLPRTKSHVVLLVMKPLQYYYSVGTFYYNTSDAFI